jgi:hypothetical protein
LSTTESWNTTLLTDRAAIGFLTTSKPPRQADPLVGLMVVVSIRIPRTGGVQPVLRRLART